VAGFQLFVVVWLLVELENMAVATQTDISAIGLPADWTTHVLSNVEHQRLHHPVTPLRSHIDMLGIFVYCGDGRTYCNSTSNYQQSSSSTAAAAAVAATAVAVALCAPPRSLRCFVYGLIRSCGKRSRCTYPARKSILRQACASLLP